MLTFDEATHTYRIGDRRLPSVTQVLKLAGLIDTDWYTEEGRQRGEYIHKALELYDHDDLDMEQVDPAWAPHLNAWIKFRCDSGITLKMVEAPVHNPTFMYAGTLDRLGLINGDYWLIDIKRGGVQPWQSLQSAGYNRCIEVLQYRARRACVFLKDDGTYRLVEHKDHNDANVFVAAAAVAIFKLNNNYKEEDK